MSLPEDQQQLLQSFEKDLEQDLASFIAEKQFPEVKLWGVTLWPLSEGVSSPKARSVILLKFLKARDWNLENAKKQLLDTLAWRIEFKTDSILEETFPEEFASLGYIQGVDKDNNPVVYNTYGKIVLDAIFPNGNIESFIRWRVQLMERTLSMLDFETREYCTQIHDYHGATMLTFNGTVKSASRELIRMFQDYYPETLCKKYFIRMPNLFEVAFNMFAPLIPEQTRKKMIVCGGSYRAKLLESIDADQLPGDYGGFSQGSDSSGTLPELIDLELKAGQVETITTQVKAQQTIHWNVLTQDKDFELSVSFESLDGQDTKNIFSGRIESQKDSFETPSDGKLVVTLSNKYSFMTKKQLKYRIY